MKRTDSLVRKFISKQSENVKLKILNIEAKRSKLISKCESIAKRSELVYFETSQYRSEANRFASDFVLEMTKKSELSFFLKTKGKKRKCSIVN